MNKLKLFSPAILGNIELRNHIAMAPMTRNRNSPDNIPGLLVANYYEQRAGAGLIITEGTSPSSNGVGYRRIPGIYNKEQIEGWKMTTEAVHKKGGKIFLQLMHTGRVSNILNLPEGAEVVAPSAIMLSGHVMTDSAGLQPFSMPREMTKDDINKAIAEYITASVNAMEAGFDGIELHGANGYLIEQFLSPHTNHRSDSFGGSVEKRTHFVLELVKGVAEAIGTDRTAIRLSPYGVNAGMTEYPEVEETYLYLAKKLNDMGIVYIHLVDHSPMGAPEVPLSLKKKIRDQFGNSMMLSGGYDKARAEEDLESGIADLIAFGKPFISNPDLVERMEKDATLAAYDKSTFYTPGEKGYTDYPALG